MLYYVLEYKIPFKNPGFENPGLWTISWSIKVVHKKASVSSLFVTLPVLFSNLFRRYSFEAVSGLRPEAGLRRAKSLSLYILELIGKSSVKAVSGLARRSPPKILASKESLPMRSPPTSRGGTSAGAVGATGFEPTTSTSRTWRATGLRYAPKFH